MPSTSVAFFRNLNLGQRRSPSRAQLLEAFTEAGAESAVSFQTNGTVIFDAGNPPAIAERVVRLLTPVCGYDDAVLVRPAEWVLGLELAAVGPNAEVSVFDGPAVFPEQLPYVAPSGRVSVVQADAVHAISLNRLERTSYATPALEQLLGVPVTSRGVPTMLRLAARLH